LAGTYPAQLHFLEIGVSQKLVQRNDRHRGRIYFRPDLHIVRLTTCPATGPMMRERTAAS
jgi:hypothetical protein